MAKTGGGDTIVARGVRIQGDFNVDGNIQIEGEVQGTIVATGDLQIGPEAKVEANIKAQNVILAGRVQGNLEVSGKTELLASSQFSGDLLTQVLSVGAGAQLNGTVSMGSESGQKMSRGKRASDTSTEDDE